MRAVRAEPVPELAALPAAEPVGRRVLAVNSGWQMVSFLARGVSTLGVGIMLAHAGGPDELGRYSLAITVAALAGFLVGLGLPNLLTREVSRDPSSARAWLESGLATAFGSGALVTAAVFVVTSLVAPSSSLLWPLVLATAALAPDAAARILFATFWAWERMVLEAKATVWQELSFLGGAGAAVALGGGTTAVVAVWLGSRVVGCAVAWTSAARRLHAIPLPRIGLSRLRWLLVKGWPFAVDDALSMAYIRVDVVLLGAMRGPVAVGLYQAGTSLVLSLNILARMVNNALYPRLCRSWVADRREFVVLRDASLRLLALVGLPVAVGSIIVAGPLMTGLYGDRFDSAVLCYQVLALIIPVRMLAHTLGSALTAADAQGARTLAVTLGAVANVLLNLAFIPLWSYVGAAIATVVTEVGVFAAYGVMLRRRVGRGSVVASCRLPAVATTVLAIGMLVTRDQTFTVQVGVGAAAYLLCVAVGVARRISHRPWSRGDLVTALTGVDG